MPTTLAAANVFAHPDHLSLMHGVCRDPWDGAARAAARDWLLERVGSVRCERCDGCLRVCDYFEDQSRGEGYECPTCHGTGSASNGVAERVEFIQIQEEMEPLTMHGHGPNNPHGGDCETCLRAAQLARKERFWIESNRRRLRAEHPDFCIGLARQGWPDQNENVMLFRRGHVARIECTLTAWREHGAAVVGAAPIETLRLQSTSPFVGPHGRFGWWKESMVRQFHARTAEAEEEFVPGEDDVFDECWKLLSAKDADGTGIKYYASAEAARDDLNAAALDWARSLHGWPALAALRPA